MSDNPQLHTFFLSLPLHLICIDTVLSTAWLHGGQCNGRATSLAHSLESAFMLLDERSGGKAQHWHN